MRRTSLFTNVTRAAFTGAAALLIAGLLGACATGGRDSHPNRSVAPIDPTSTKPPKPRTAEDLNERARQYAQRIADARATSSASDPGPSRGAASKSAVDWVDQPYLKTADPPRTADIGAKTAGKTGADSIGTQPGANASVKPTTDATSDKPATKRSDAPHKASAGRVNLDQVDRAAVVAQLVKRIGASGEPEMTKAMHLAALALIEGKPKLDAQQLDKLRPSQRELVNQFYALINGLARQVTAGETIDREALAKQLNMIIGEQPVSIRRVELCKRVRGYGVYDKVDSDALLTGREHPLVVYVELDNFKVQQDGARLNNYMVSISQELVLYNESDGLAVWRQPEQRIVDESRNRRRDFFIVQPTRLPSRLNVGKYILKVRVRDRLGGTRDEVSVPIRIVADPALVRPAPRTPRVPLGPGSG